MVLPDAEILTSARRALRAFHVPTKQYRFYYAFARKMAVLERTCEDPALVREAGSLTRLWVNRGLQRLVLTGIRMELRLRGCK